MENGKQAVIKAIQMMDDTPSHWKKTKRFLKHKFDIDENEIIESNKNWIYFNTKKGSKDRKIIAQKILGLTDDD